jgi:molecular chaperone DnaK
MPDNPPARPERHEISMVGHLPLELENFDEDALPLPRLPSDTLVDDEETTHVHAAGSFGMPAFPAAPFGALARPEPPAARAPSAPPTPLLVDVTPLTLCVETVGGYCDIIIARNSAVPCEQSRQFATAADNQTSVYVRVGQGESSRFEENTLLGELELSGLTPAPRGKTKLSVTFALDANGILDVSAKDVATGRATSAQLRLVGLPGADAVAEMAQRQAQLTTL